MGFNPCSGSFLVCEPVPCGMGFGQHIRLRWWQRGGRDDPNVHQAWTEGVAVGLPGQPNIKARLHRETGTVIARKGGGGGTVLNSEHMVLYRNGGLVCGNCLCRLQEDHRCPNDDCFV